MQHFRHKLLKIHINRLSLCALFLLTIAIGILIFTQNGGDERADTQARAPQPLDGLVVAVDAGHGGYDGGARARDSGIWEKDINLQVALKVEKELTSQGARVVMTRRTDISLEGEDKSMSRKRADLRARMDMANSEGAHALISIHMNEYRSRSESGPQVFYQHGGDAGRLLAGALQQALIDTLNPPKQRVAMAGNYYILRGELPSALVECGFISNAAEEKLLLNEEYQQKIALAIATGLVAWRALDIGE